MREKGDYSELAPQVFDCGGIIDGKRSGRKELLLPADRCFKFTAQPQPLAIIIFAAFARTNAKLINGSELNRAALVQYSFAFALLPLPR